MISPAPAGLFFWENYPAKRGQVSATQGSLTSKKWRPGYPRDAIQVCEDRLRQKAIRIAADTLCSS